MKYLYLLVVLGLSLHGFEDMTRGNLILIIFGCLLGWGIREATIWADERKKAS